MNLALNLSIRFITFAVVLTPFFMWWAMAMKTPYVVPGSCEPGDYECRIDSIDARQVP